jgi:hypothetical protein
MALLLADSIPYDHSSKSLGRYTFNQFSGWDYPNVQTSGGLYNRRYINCWSGYWSNGSWGGVSSQYNTFGGQQTTIMNQFAYYPTSYVSSYLVPTFFLEAATGVHVWMRDTGGQLAFYRGDNSTLLASASSTITMAWHFIEIKIYFHASAGTILMKVDGVTLVNATGLATKYAANGYCNQIAYNYPVQNQGYFRLSDMIIMDTTGSYCNDLLGPRIVEQLVVPTANGNYAQWTPSAGQNYACVDEVPPNDDTDYVSTTTVGNSDTFVVPDLSLNSPIISGVMVSPYCKSVDVGIAKIKGMARSNGVDGLGTEQVVPVGTYMWTPSPIYLDPNTNQPWTGAGFNAAEFGYQKSA